MWKYDSPVGCLYIERIHNHYNLMFENDCYLTYDAPDKVADDVFCFATGIGEYDILVSSITPPSDLSEWEEC